MYSFYLLKTNALLLLLGLHLHSLNAQSSLPKLRESLSPKVYNAPKYYDVPKQHVEDIKAIFYESIEFQGKPTRVFAYLGIPKSNKPVPAMVLVHGGGGTAFHQWVKIWNAKGYAAIAMSLEGHMPDDNQKGKLKHDYSGPSRVGMFDDIDKPLKEQWMYHAVSDIMLAHSLIASLPEVDANRIGMTGISWGGVLSSLTSGVDKRFKCVAPVYGAGFLYDSKGHFKDMGKGTEAVLKKKRYWDPANYFAKSKMPTLWVNGDVDAHFSINITSQSHHLIKDNAQLCIHPSMPHGHGAGWDSTRVPEIYTFVDHILKKKGTGLGRISKQPKGLKVKLSFESKVAVKEANIYYLEKDLSYTNENKKFGPGNWQVIKAVVKGNTVTGQLPESCKNYYVNLKDINGNIISSKLVSL